MYINNIHILYYVALIFLGIITGQLTDWAIKRMPEYKKVFSKDIFKEYKKEFKPNYILIAINCIINVALLYILGWNNTSLVSNTELIKYLIITPMLLTAFVIDYKLQIIPNKLNLTLLEVGIIFMLINGIFDINMAVNMLLGMVTGAGIFLLITWIGRSNGIWRRKTNGSIRFAFWFPKYNCYRCYVIFNWSYFKHIFISN